MRTAISALLFCLLCANVHGQSTFATITGSVTDATGGSIPSAEVTAIHKTLGLRYTTRSNEVGVYTLPECREGEYTVRSKKEGFKEFVADNIVLSTRTVRRVDVQLDLGSLTESVEVTAQVGAIETERATISTVRSMKELNTSPIAANSLYYMFMTMPMTQPRGSSPSFAGTRNDQYQMSVDGASINSGTGGVISNLAGQPETFKEMKVEMVNNTAEHSGLGHVLLVTKSGENSVHGSVFWNYQSPSLRARDFFASERDAGISHRGGFGIGGPVFLPKIYNGKNRTFWFVTADSTFASQLREELRPSVPLEAWRNGDFSGLGVQIRNPFTGEIYQDGRIPRNLINPVAKKFQDWFYPLPNVGDPNKFAARNHLSVMRGTASKEYHFTNKLDHRITDSDYVYASFQLHEVDVNDWDGSLPAFGWKDQLRITKSLALGHTHTFGPRLMNEFRFAHAFNSFPRRGPLRGRDVVNQLGLQGLFPDLPDVSGYFRVSFAGVGIETIAPTDEQVPGNVNKNTQFHDDVSFFAGKHNIKAGVQFATIGFDNRTIAAGTFGSASFANTFTKVPGVTNSGHPYADFLFGVPTSVNRASLRPVEVRDRNAYDFYIQDDWKATRRLTLNLGLRYEYHAPWTEASGLLAAFDRKTGQVVVADEGMAKISPFVPKGYVNIVKASDAGLPGKSIVYGDRNNIGPRIAAAFRPFAGNTTVVRGGYGLFYDMTPFKPSSASTPFVMDEPSYTNPANPVVVLPWVFPAASTGSLPSMSLPGSMNPHIRMPYTQQWSFTIEHERWGTGLRASYVGTAGRQMWWSADMNAPLPGPELYINKARPFPKYPNISYTDNGGNHTYNALSLQATRKVRRGPQFQVAYTWARDIGDDLDPENPFDRSRDRGPDAGLPNQRLTAMALYELPFGRGQRLFPDVSRAIDKAINGWELSVITYQQTGQHLTPSITIPDPTGTRFTNTATRPNVTIRPDVLRNPNWDTGSIDQWYDVSAFAAPPVGAFGNAGRGIIDGPGTNVFHASVHKSIRFTDNANGPQFRIGLVATNVLNHTNFFNPEVNVNRVGASGKITRSGGPNNSNPGDRAGARAMFLRLRLEW